MEVVNFTDDTYLSLSNDTITNSECDIILWTNRVRCALNMEILDLLNEESISGVRSSRASL